MPETIDPELLCQSWVHAHEEDGRSLTVFRPSTFSLPPSRGREELQLHPDGTVGGKTPGPTDRRVGRSGTWSIDRGVLTIEVPSSKRSWIIEELTRDKLVLRDRTLNARCR